MTAWDSRLSAALAARREAGLWRQRPLLTGVPSVIAQVNGRRVLNFASNDYLGLASDASLAAEALVLNADAGFAGSTASHVLAGHHLPHHLLEDALADWLGVERVLLFSSGYLANLAVQTALLQVGDLVVHDKLNHASLIDGAQLSSATFKRYPHNDMQALARRLAEPQSGLCMIVSDGVFSMDGDQANLSALTALADQYDALLVVDEAHAFGVLGSAGTGSFSAQGIQANHRVLRVGTLGKAFASSGAFIAGSALLIDTIAQFARPYIYTTAQPPYQASFSRAVLQRIQAADGLRSHLKQLIMHFKQGASALGLQLMPSETPIQPIILGDLHRAVRWQGQLWEAGLWVPAIRPPTVPQGTARLRVSLSAKHTIEDIDQLLALLGACQEGDANGVSHSVLG